MSLYLILDLSSLAVPFLFSFHPKLKFYKEWPYFFPALLLTGLFFVVWDVYFTKWGVWGFNPRYLEGIYLSGLPLEEYLFFICIPFASIFTIHAFRKIYPDFTIKPILLKSIVGILSGILLLTGLIFHENWYTFSTGIISGILILWSYFICRNALHHFFLTYPVILIPFFIVNGILTGSFIEGEVVWYNDEENLGIRMFTIPLEDTFYGMSMLLMTVMLSAFFKQKFSTKLHGDQRSE